MPQTTQADDTPTPATRDETVADLRATIELREKRVADLRAEFHTAAGEEAEESPADQRGQSIVTRTRAVIWLATLDARIEDLETRIENVSKPKAEPAAGANDAAKPTGSRLEEVLAERDEAIQERDTARSRVSELEHKLKETPKGPKALQDARQEISLLQLQKGILEEKLGKACVDVNRLETFCGLRGLVPSQLAPCTNEMFLMEGEALFAQFQKLSGAARTQFLRENQKKLDAYAEQVSKQDKG